MLLVFSLTSSFATSIDKELQALQTIVKCKAISCGNAELITDLTVFASRMEL